MGAIGKPPYRRGSKKTTDFKVGILDGKPSIQVNWGGRIYGSPLALVGSGNQLATQRFRNLHASGFASFGSGVRVGPDSTSKSSLRVASDGALSIGVKGGTPNFSVSAAGVVSVTTGDINLTPSAGVIANGDSIIFIDANDSNNTKKEALADVATLFAGTGLTASSSVIGVDASQTQITSVGTIGTGTWEATDVGVAHGGTGLSTVGTNYLLTGNDTGALTAESNLTYASGTFTFGNATSIVTSSGDLTLAPTGDIKINPTGSDVTPTSNWDINLGSSTLQWKSFHAAELVVQTLVAKDVMSTIGGRILVAPTTELIIPLVVDTNPIIVKHNGVIAVDDIIVMQTYVSGTAQFEAMKVTASNGASGGGFSYSVTRGFDSTGAHAWKEGDAVVNTGGVGDGYIDLYSDHSLNVSGNSGPTIVGQVRSAVDEVGGAAVEPMWAIGNLDGWYGKGNDDYGVGIGKWSAECLIATAADIKFYNAETVTASWEGDVITLGQSAQEHIVISSTDVKMFNGITETSSWIGDVITLGNNANNKITLNGASGTLTMGSNFTATAAGVIQVTDIELSGKVTVTGTDNNISIGDGQTDGGDNNICIGYNAGAALTTDGDENIAIGTSALLTNADTAYAVAIGYEALKVSVGQQGINNNVAIGYKAGVKIDYGLANTILGAAAGDEMTGSDFNVVIGQNAAASLVSGSSNVVAGFLANLSSTAVNQTVIGSNADGQGNNYAVIGDGNVTRLYAAEDGAGVLYANATIVSSDKRMKENIEDINIGLDFINKLTPITYTKRQPVDYNQSLKENLSWYGKKDPRVIEDTQKAKIRPGFLAQDVEDVLKELNFSENNSIIEVDDVTTQYSMDYASMVVPLVKAVQELSAKFDNMDERLTNLEGV
jgi:hypothetical protein